jgi:hypothetical protein
LSSAPKQDSIAVTEPEREMLLASGTKISVTFPLLNAGLRPVRVLGIGQC